MQDAGEVSGELSSRGSTPLRWWWLIVVASALLGVAAGGEPTGGRLVDIVLAAALAAVVTWAGARAPSRVLVVAAGIAAVAAASATVVVVLTAWAALAVAIAAALRRTGAPVVSAVVAAATVQVCLRLEWSPFFTASAWVSAVVCVLIVVAGVRARSSIVRRRALRIGLAIGVFVVVAGAGMAVAGVSSRTSATDGYHQLLSGLDLVQSGDMDGATDVLRSAADELHDAVSSLDAPWVQPARLLPGIAQNRAAGTELMQSAADAADSVADVLDQIDLAELRVVDGVIDVDAIERISQPLSELSSMVGELRSDLGRVDSAWLVAPLRDRLTSARIRATEVARQAEAAASAAAQAPAMLGSDEERRYLIAFSTPAESRGSNGLLGNWTELTITDGALRVTHSGRVSGLMELTAQRSAPIKATDEFFERYGFVGAGGPDKPIRAGFWQNVTMSPDMPSVGGALVQMYEQTTGRSVDGVFLIDPAGIAALLDITGPVTVPGLTDPLDSGNVEKFLLLDQYANEQSDREDLLNAVTEATVAHVLTSSLPGPQVLAQKMAPAALSGHLSAFAVRPEEQAMFELVGMDARLPTLEGGDEGADALAVVTQNAGGNKIDSFLQRDISYASTYDPVTGSVVADLDIHLENSAPTDGYPPYVISNQVGIRDGTNRMILSIFTPLGLEAVTLDGDRVGATAETELGYNVYSLVVDIPSKSAVDVHIDLMGTIGAGRYRLIYRPQPLPNTDRLQITTSTSGGDMLVDLEGTLSRRSTLDAQGVEAWR